jgi:hypothetical protein
MLLAIQVDLTRKARRLLIPTYRTYTRISPSSKELTSFFLFRKEREETLVKNVVSALRGMKWHGG